MVLKVGKSSGATEAVTDDGVAAAQAGAACDVNAVAAADAATTGAAEAAAARPGPEKRHIDDVTPGGSLGTRAHAREWAGSDTEDDSEMSVEEEEEDSGAEESVGATRAQWVKDDVALLREADLGGLIKHKEALYRNLSGNCAKPGSTACLCILPQEQSKAGVERFANMRIVLALLRHLPYVQKQTVKAMFPGGKNIYSLVLRFTSQSEAQAARDRILEEHRGGAWPTFAVIFAFPSIVLSMEQPLETRSPGPAM
jgi:hypothetical protein